MIYTDKSLPGPGVQADWTAGDIGMVLGRANAFATLGELPFGWDIVSVPDGPNGFVPERAQNGIGVWSDAPNSDLAARVRGPHVDQGECGEVRRQHAVGAQVAGQPGCDPAGQQGAQRRPAHALGDQGADAQNFKLEYSHSNYPAVEKQINQTFDAKIWNESGAGPARAEPGVHRDRAAAQAVAMRDG